VSPLDDPGQKIDISSSGPGAGDAFGQGQVRHASKMAPVSALADTAEHYQFTGRNYQTAVPDNAYLAGMQCKNAYIGVRVEPQLIERSKGLMLWQGRQRRGRAEVQQSFIRAL
jgi:hypothetical protein